MNCVNVALKKYFCLGLVLSLVGCATTYQPVSSENILEQPPLVPSKSQSAEVVVKRPDEFLSAMEARFFYDGVHIVTLKEGETFTFQATPGMHKLGVKSSDAIILLPMTHYREIEVELKPRHRHEYLFYHRDMEGLWIKEVK